MRNIVKVVATGAAIVLTAVATMHGASAETPPHPPSAVVGAHPPGAAGIEHSSARSRGGEV